jgi:hypothetical protein
VSFRTAATAARVSTRVRAPKHASDASIAPRAAERGCFAVDQLVAAIERMLGDVGMAGSGGGTFSALLPVYGTVADIATGAGRSRAAGAKRPDTARLVGGYGPTDTGSADRHEAPRYPT